MSALSAAASDEDSDRIKELQTRLRDTQECLRSMVVERTKVRDAVKRLHAAKGRYHTQLALCDLFDLVGLSSDRPNTQVRKSSAADINVRNNHDKTRAAVPDATAVGA